MPFHGCLAQLGPGPVEPAYTGRPMALPALQERIGEGWWVMYNHLLAGVGLQEASENDFQRNEREKDVEYILHCLRVAAHIDVLTNGLVDCEKMARKIGKMLRNYPPLDFTAASVPFDSELWRPTPYRLKLDMSAFLLEEPPPGEDIILRCYGAPGYDLDGVRTQHHRRVMMCEIDPEAGTRPEWMVGASVVSKVMIILANDNCNVGLDIMVNGGCQIPRDDIVVKKGLFTEFNLLNPNDGLFGDSELEDVSADDDGFALVEDLVIPRSTGNLIRGLFLHIHCARWIHVNEHERMVLTRGEDLQPWTAMDINDGTHNPTLFPGEMSFPDQTYAIFVFNYQQAEQLLHEEVQYYERLQTLALGTHKRLGQDSPIRKWDLGTDHFSAIAKFLHTAWIKGKAEYLNTLRDCMKGKMPPVEPDPESDREEDLI